VSADDLTILALAAENVDLRERLRATETYREIAKAAIEKLAEQRADLEYANRRIAALVDENRSHSVTESDTVEA
jgi:hypothetical protein